ncbi:YiiX/YebB-like N1pC/P60 family cysteine hydrolase [Akkermansiaceae bacterium]|nr:YiiX/YebB-like N1pC/P60 family cysteine hydrolase [Akkermansiaceae bacterium]
MGTISIVEIQNAWRILQTVQPALPQRAELEQEVLDAVAAQDRGYYLPDEDERLREVYSRYLAARGTLWEMVLALEPRLAQETDEQERMELFGISFCAAAMLVRSANFIINVAAERPVVWKKLDEAEPKYGLQRKNFTCLYRSVTSPRWMWAYTEAIRFYESERENVHQALKIRGMDQAVEWLIYEEPFFENSRRDLLKKRFSYRLHSFIRRHVSGYNKVMFQMFRMGGSVVAEMKQPFKKRSSDKRVTSDVREKVRSHLRAGDVIVTRHDDALSNLFLPGYWPHGALYIGSVEEREAMGIEPCDASKGRIAVLEAKKDGVLFRALEETLAVDAFVVLRPSLEVPHLKEALERAISHEGKLYDFAFDFRNADRLVCTEVVYRAYHSIGGIEFELTQRSGRHCLSAEDLLRQGIEKELFEVVLCYGIEGDEMRHGEMAKSRLLASLRKYGEPIPEG